MHPTAWPIAALILACADPSGTGGDSGRPGSDGGSSDGGSSDGGGLDTGADALLALAVQHSPLPALPDEPTNARADDPDAAWLGRWLFFDTRLSASGTHSCATCHDPDLGFGDGQAFSQAAGTTTRHSPTIWNTAWNDWMFWDGRADSHWAQALKPIEDPAEQATSRLAVVHLVAQDAELRLAYEGIFGPLPDLSDSARFPAQGKPTGDPDDPLDQAWRAMAADDQHTVNVVFSNLGKAIAAYERQLIRGDAPFDRWVQGLQDGDPEKLAAISEQAVAGFELYRGQGNCHLCHAGPTFTNNSFHNVGLAWVPGIRKDDLGRYDGIATLLEDPFNGLGAYSDDPDAALYKLGYLTQGADQLGQFKVPSLRNVALSPPYMHGGQLPTLTDVVRFYSELDQQPTWGHREDLLVPLEWDEAQIASVVAFLESLTGAEPDPMWMGPPASPVPESWAR